MREIKFRVWDKVGYMSSVFTLKDLQEIKVQFTEDCPVMQFTGLLDRHETEIYEGDIMKLKDGTLGVVEFYKDAWYLLIRKVPMTRATIFAGEEVIGNQFENPELIQKWHK